MVAYDARVAGKAGLIFLWLTAVTPFVMADSFREPPKTPWETYEPLWYFYTSNDSFGYPFQTECDDLRTFGLLAGYYTDSFFFNVDFYSLMNRGEPGNTASSRVDELRVNAGYTAFNWDWPGFVLNVTPGLGLLVHGNLGTGAFQTGFHDLFHYSGGRPMPANYDDQSLYALAFVSVDFAEKFLNMFNLKIHSQFLHNLNFTTDFTLGYWVVKKYFQIDYSATYSFNFIDNFSPAARAVYDSESGLWINSTVMAGCVFFERSLNLMTLAPAGSIGVKFGRTVPDKTQDLIRISYSLHGTFGFASNIEMLQVHPLLFFPNLSLFLRVQKFEDFDKYQKMLRLNVSSCGANVSLFDPAERTYINPFAYVGYGFVDEKNVTNDFYRDRAIEQNFRPIMHFGLGGRFKLGDACAWLKWCDFGNFDFGVEFAWDFRITFSDATIFMNPYSSGTYGFYISQ